MVMNTEIIKSKSPKRFGNFSDYNYRNDKKDKFEGENGNKDKELGKW